MKRAGVGQGLRVGVVGAGGVGLHLVQLAALAGGEVVALDDRPDARDRAEDVGADEVATVGDESLADALDGPVDRLLVTAQHPVELADAIAVLVPGGRLVLVDLPAPDPAQLPVAEVVTRELDVVGANGLTLPDVVELFDLAAEGRLILTTALGGQHSADDLADVEAVLATASDGRPHTVDPRPTPPS